MRFKNSLMILALSLSIGSCAQGAFDVDPIVWAPILIRNEDKSVNIQESYWKGVKQSDPHNTAFHQKDAMIAFMEKGPVCVDAKTYSEMQRSAKEKMMYIHDLEERLRNCGGANIQEQQGQGN